MIVSVNSSDGSGTNPPATATDFQGSEAKAETCAESASGDDKLGPILTSGVTMIDKEWQERKRRLERRRRWIVVWICATLIFATVALFGVLVQMYMMYLG